MASTYSTNLAIELIGTGDQAGSWGNTTNTNLGTLIEQAISGYVTQAVSTGTDTTITIPNGATGVARNMYIELTGTGGASTNLIVPANKKLYFIFNNTSSGQVTVKVSGQTGVSVPQGKKMVLVSNGTDVVVAENYIADFGSNSATITNLTCTSLTLSNNPTFSGGTANGVLYLNGSKVATSGSALVFDGTNLNLNSGTAVSATSGGSVTAGVFAARAPLSAHQTAVGVLQYSANETTLRSYGATGVTGALVFNLGAGGSADAEYMRLTSSVLSTVAGVNVGIGTATPGSYLSGTAKLVALANANSQNSILVRNDNAGSSASCAIALNASGNTWGIECGSTAKNNNALTFQLDYGGANSTLMMLTSSGNLGLGVTPSAWSSGYKATQIKNISTFTASLDANFGSNVFVNSAGNYAYIANGVASIYTQNAGTHVWQYAPSGTANNPISFTQAMTLSAAGDLGVGTTSPGYRLEVYKTDPTANRTNPLDIMAITANNGNAPYDGFGAGLVFKSSTYLYPTPREVARIRSKLNDNSALNYGSSLVFDTTPLNSSSPTQAMELNYAGNLGLGVTPSAWTTYTALQIKNGSVANYSPTQDFRITANAYYDSGNWKYIASAYALQNIFDGGAGAFKWMVAASGSAGANTTNSTNAAGNEVMTLNASGNLGVGTASPTSIGGYKTVTVNGTTGSLVDLASNGTVGARIQCDTSYPGMALFGLTNHPMVFGTNATERGRFTAGGELLVGTTTNTNNFKCNFQFDGSSTNGLMIRNNAASGTPSIFFIYDSAQSLNNTGRSASYEDNAALRWALYKNGGLANYQANDVNLSDQRVKKDVKPLGSMWDKFKAIEIVTFKYNDQTHDDDNIGVIAQQVESVAPEFIDVDGFGETPEDGVPLKTVYTTDMYHAAIKALQEAMARIEKLEAEMVALKGA